jgi:hypothetical protein
MTRVFRFLLARLSEVSTWKGILLILTGGTAYAAPELQDAIITIGLAAVGAINVATPEPASPAGE